MSNIQATYRDDLSDLDIDKLYDALFGSAIVRFTDLPTMQALVDFAREYLGEQLNPYALTEVHRHYDRATLAERLADVRHRFTNLAEVNKLWRAILRPLAMTVEQEPFGLSVSKPKGNYNKGCISH